MALLQRRGETQRQLLEAVLSCFWFLVCCRGAHVLAGGRYLLCALVAGATFYSITVHLCRQCYKSWKASANGLNDLPRRFKRPLIQLPVFKLSALTLEQKKDTLTAQGNRCPICLENLRHDHEVCVPPCGHVFHSECIHTWMKYSTIACPCCRRDMWGS